MSCEEKVAKMRQIGKNGGEKVKKWRGIVYFL